MRGYDPEQVDEFLDNIIRDYEEYTQENLTLQEEVARLQAKISNMTKVQKAVAPASREHSSSRSAAVTNFDILKRLSNLEREVFGKKLVKDEDEEKVAKSTAYQSSVFEKSELDDQATRLI
jgi:cell division septum initiation protein DivIVA